MITTCHWLDQGAYPFYYIPPFKNMCLINEYKPLLPVLILPGCNDWCLGIDYFVDAIEEHSNNEIICIEYAKKIDSIFKNMKKLIKLACKQISLHENKLKDGYIIMGLSMGGLIAWGVIQECEQGKYAKRLITFGTPNMGVAKVPSETNTLPERILNWMTIRVIYNDVFQRFISSANFFRHPHYYDKYLNSDTYLKHLNNEIDVVEQYRERIRNLDLMVNVHFDNESFLVPKQTAYWGYYSMEHPFELLDFTETIIYQEDRIGVKYLHERNRLVFLEFKGRHQNVDMIYNPEFCQLFLYLI